MEEANTYITMDQNSLEVGKMIESTEMEQVGTQMEISNKHNKHKDIIL